MEKSNTKTYPAQPIIHLSYFTTFKILYKKKLKQISLTCSTNDIHTPHNITYLLHRQTQQYSTAYTCGMISQKNQEMVRPAFHLQLMPRGINCVASQHHFKFHKLKIF